MKSCIALICFSMAVLGASFCVFINDVYGFRAAEVALIASVLLVPLTAVLLDRAK